MSPSPGICKHDKLTTNASSVNVSKKGKIIYRRLKMTANCAHCGIPMHFPGFSEVNDSAIYEVPTTTNKGTHLSIVVEVGMKPNPADN